MLAAPNTPAHFQSLSCPPAAAAAPDQPTAMHLSLGHAPTHPRGAGGRAWLQRQHAPGGSRPEAAPHWGGPRGLACRLQACWGLCVGARGWRTGAPRLPPAPARTVWRRAQRAPARPGLMWTPAAAAAARGMLQQALGFSAPDSSFGHVELTAAWTAAPGTAAAGGCCRPCCVGAFRLVPEHSALLGRYSSLPERCPCTASAWQQNAHHAH